MPNIFYAFNTLSKKYRRSMSTSILKTHYRRSATVLTSEQIEEIRHLKNKVPAYMIVKEYHINKNRVYDI